MDLVVPDRFSNQEVSVPTNVRGIILAAGLSSRAGTCKLTLDLRGITVIESCIQGMYDVCSKITVIGGCHHEKLEPILINYNKVSFVLNKNYHSGMLSSVYEGFRKIFDSPYRNENSLENSLENSFFIIPGDCPLVSPDTYKILLNTFDDIVVPTYRGISGHPVLLSANAASSFINDYPSLRYNSLKDFISDYGFVTVEVNDPGVLIDIDTLEDYEKVKGMIKNSLHSNRGN